MLKKYITNLYGQSESSTAMLAQNTVTKIAENDGYSEIRIQAYPVQESDTEVEKEKRIEGILSGIPKESLLIVQLPTWNGIAFDEVFLKKAREKTNHLVIFIHDFVPLMFVNNEYLFERYLLAYNFADLVIVPSKKMEEILRGRGLNTVTIIQSIWDHIVSLQLDHYPQFYRKIKFIGNSSRFPFVGNWKSDLELEVFSQGNIKADGFLTLRGWLPDDQLLRELNRGGFGLVWSENIENQYEREYSEMNVSHKFSTYLAAGLPIIVNKGLAKEEFVRKYCLGLVVENLEEAVNHVKTMTPREYQAYITNVRKVSYLIKEGYFTKQLLLDIQKELFL